jgi:hypothetical protein
MITPTAANFIPEDYTIFLSEDLDEDDSTYYIGSVLEFPNIKTFERTKLEAYDLVVDAITTLRKIALTTDGYEYQNFPIPNKTNQLNPSPYLSMVFSALEDPKYDFRTLLGLMLDTGLSSSCIKQTFNLHPSIVRICKMKSLDGQVLYTSANRKIKFRERLAFFLHNLKKIC